MFQRAKEAPLPPAAEKFGLPDMQLLVALCYQLQRAAEETGGNSFLLSCRDAGRLLGISYATASRWLGLMQRAGVVRLLVLGSRKRIIKGDSWPMMASEYRYIAE